MARSTLAQALAWIDEDEGPELNISPDEPGGSSKHGVSMEKLIEWHKLKGLPLPTMEYMRKVDGILAAEIYTEMFAKPLAYDRLPVGVDYVLLDASVNLGISGGPRLLQEVLGVPQTGKMDEHTISQVNIRNPVDLAKALGDAWLAYKKAHGGWAKYGKGWTNRADKVQKRAASLLSGSQEQDMARPWRLAKSIQQLLDQVNAEDPHRRKDSDGGIGDAAHASRGSDHNPYIVVNGEGVVRAFDFTHAPETGFDARAFAEVLRKNKDSRLRYVICNYRIMSGKEGPQPWEWRPYHVPPNLNPHDHHTHVSVTEKESEFDSPAKWNLGGMAEAVVEQAPAANNYVPPPTTLRIKARGELVKKMQAGIGLTGAAVDGFFGPNTEKALKVYQTAHGLHADGICGPQTWKLIG